MSAEAVGAPIRSPSPAAERMRLYRRRRRFQSRVVRIEIHPAEIAELVRKSSAASHGSQADVAR
jgi:hypothetical protein